MMMEAVGNDPKPEASSHRKEIFDLEPNPANFDCNICLETTQDPVVTLCGHLFCWPCLYRWLELHSILKECPVCKAMVNVENVIPLYGKGKLGVANPLTKRVPGIKSCGRPPGRRTHSARPAGTNFQTYGFNFVNGHSGHVGRGRHMTLPGHFPSLLGFHMTGFPRNNRNFSRAAYGIASSRIPGNSVHYLRSNQQQELFLYWLFILLVSFMVACLLFF